MKIMGRWTHRLRRVVRDAAWSNTHLFWERQCRQEFLGKAIQALTFNGIEGDYVEFGCWGGMTFGLAYEEIRLSGKARLMWGFDSFSGLPKPKSEKDSHPRWLEGEMKTSVEDFHEICKRSRIPRSSYKVVEGFYENTLDKQKPDTEYPTNVALAYVDCDLYSSTMSVLKFLSTRFKHGMILALDDYFCWSKDQISGERRALLEVFANHPTFRLLPYVQFGWHGMSFILEARSISGLAGGIGH